MVIYGSNMFKFSVNKDMEKKNNNKSRIPTCLLACFLTIIVKVLKTSVE